MTDIKTITETFWSGSNDSNFSAASGSYEVENEYLQNDEVPETLTIRLLKDKIDELVKELNILKNK